MSNAFTLLIMYARIDPTPWNIVFLYCLLIVEEVLHQFKLKIGKLNGDLLQPSGIRYDVWSFSVRHFISIAYRERLISGVKLSVVVFQAIGISLRNNMHTITNNAKCNLCQMKNRVCYYMICINIYSFLNANAILPIWNPKYNYHPSNPMQVPPQSISKMQLRV